MGFAQGKFWDLNSISRSAVQSLNHWETISIPKMLFIVQSSTCTQRHLLTEKQLSWNQNPSFCPHSPLLLLLQSFYWFCSSGLEGCKKKINKGPGLGVRHCRRLPRRIMAYCCASSRRCEMSAQSCLHRAAVCRLTALPEHSLRRRHWKRATNVGTAAAGTTADSTAGYDAHQFQYCWH